MYLHDHNLKRIKMYVCIICIYSDKNYYKPETRKGVRNPPSSYKNPPREGPNIVPAPKKDSAREIALPWNIKKSSNLVKDPRTLFKRIHQKMTIDQC